MALAADEMTRAGVHARRVPSEGRRGGTTAPAYVAFVTVIIVIVTYMSYKKQHFNNTKGKSLETGQQ